MENKTIKTEVASGVILVVVALVGGLVWLSGNVSTQDIPAQKVSQGRDKNLPSNIPTQDIPAQKDQVMIPEKQAQEQNSKSVAPTEVYQKYGFSLVIPKSWVVAVNNHDGIEEVDFIEKTGYSSTTKIQLRIASQEVFNTIIQRCSLEQRYENDNEVLKINGLADAQRCLPSSYKDFYRNLIARNKSYYFSFLDRDKLLYNSFDDVVEVVKSFRITDKNVQWKTYKDEQHGFEFQYPDTFSLMGVSSGIIDFVPIAVQYGQYDEKHAFSIDFFSLKDFSEKRAYCRSSYVREDMEDQWCYYFPVTDETYKEFGVQKNNEYYVYMRLLRDDRVIGAMTMFEQDQILSTFKVFDVVKK